MDSVLYWYFVVNKHLFGIDWLFNISDDVSQSICFYDLFLCRIYMGNNSLTIYLLHMPFAGMTAYLFNRFSVFQYIDVLRPFVTVCITIILIRGIEIFSRKFRIAWILTLFGLREYI